MKKMMIAFTSLILGLVSRVEGNPVIKPIDQRKKTAQTENVSSEKPSILNLTWSDIETSSNQLAVSLKERNWTGILAITRGGLVPAGLLAESLNIRRIETINIQSYDKEKKRGEITLLNVPDIKNAGENWLIIDDLVDSGETIKAVKKLFPNAVYAVLFAKPKGMLTVDHYVREVGQDTWIVFPWEKE
jgi:xanthine phosphoribosyltransferase